MTRVHVWGASGYGAAEAIRLLDMHPFFEVGVLESRSHAGAALADHFPLLRTTPYVFSPEGSVRTALRPGDFVIAAGAHGEAHAHVPGFIEAGARVVDLSADYRFDDNAAYGLSEWQRDDDCVDVACCKSGLLSDRDLARAVAVGRVCNAGAVDRRREERDYRCGPQAGNRIALCRGGRRHSRLRHRRHRHQPEIERLLRMHGNSTPLVFTPHVVPLARGMLADSYALFDRALDEAALRRAYASAYANSPFVRIVEGDRVPSVAAVTGTNDAELRVDVLGNAVRVICAIDNLGKGAAGQAVQNLNIMLGYPEETGLHARAIVAG